VTQIADQVTGTTSIALDKNGSPHVTVIDAAGLKYLTRTGGTWATTPVAPVRLRASAYQNELRRASLALDADDHAHVFFNQEPTGVGHATNASGTWVTEVVDSSGGDSNGSHALAIDAKGVLHAVYGQPVRHASKAAGAWSSETLAVSSNIFADPAIAVDKGGALCAAYGQLDIRDSVGWATNKSGAWAAFQLSVFVSPIRLPALAPAGQDAVHLVFSQMSRVRILRLEADGGAQDQIGQWGAYHPGFPVAIGVGPTGSVHVVYLNSSNPNFEAESAYYITNSGGQWRYCQIQSVGRSAIMVDQGLGVAVDAQDKPHVVFTDSYPTRKAYYATF